MKFVSTPFALLFPTPFVALVTLGISCLLTPLRGADLSGVLTVSGGEIQGERLPDKAGVVFRGVPFARPPVGEFRWREPMPVVPWQGVLPCDKSGSPAAQSPMGWNDQAAAASREDCLYLDVWTKSVKPRESKPVMVWIHGGGNVAGSGGFDPLYDGRSLISHGVVLVVIEYRLGIFGFFSLPELSQESPHHSSGNYAVLDQIAALQWVQDNIKNFGGDPGNVTVFGQSAGSIDISALITSPLAKGLFRRAITESGATIFAPAQTLKEAEQTGVGVAAALNVTSAERLRALRSLSTGELLKQGQSMHAVNVDGWVFPISPLKAYATGQELSVPLIIGSNAIELPVDGTSDHLEPMINRLFKDFAPDANHLYGLDASSAGKASFDPVYGGVGEQVGSDLFRCPGIVQGEWHSKAGNPTWQYEFARAIPPKPKVSHSGELCYVFGNLLSTGSQAGEFTAADRKLSSTIQTYWTNFAKTGNPNGAGVPLWPNYDGTTRKYLQFAVTTEISVGENQRGPYTDLYRKVLTKAASE